MPDDRETEPQPFEQAPARALPGPSVTDELAPAERLPAAEAHPRRPRRSRPKTSSRLWHGLRASEIPLRGIESGAEWSMFRADVINALGPDGAVEHTLASRVAEILWRLRRVAPAERQFIEYQQKVDEAARASDARLTPLDDAAAEIRRRAFEGETPVQEARVPRRMETDTDDAYNARMLDFMVGNFYGGALAIGQSRVRARASVVAPPHLIPPGESLDRIIRYEGHLNRQLQHTLASLEALQRRRIGEDAPLARVAVHHLSGS